MSARFDLIVHARERLRTRGLREEWIESALTQPEKTLSDPTRPGVMLAWRRVPEFGDRWLRVAYRNDLDRVIIITAFDRGAKP